MLKATARLKDFIENQRSKPLLAERWGVSLATVYKIVNSNGDINGDTVARILSDTGFDFDTAFNRVN